MRFNHIEVQYERHTMNCIGEIMRFEIFIPTILIFMVMESACINVSNAHDNCYIHNTNQINVTMYKNNHVFPNGFNYNHTQNMGQIRGHIPINSKTYQKLIGVGIDVDWMSFPRVHRYYFYWRSKGVNIPHYFKEEGFSNVRIRVGADVVSNKTALIQLGEIVNDSLDAGIIPIITYTAPELRNNPTDKKAQEHFVKWWKTVANYFKGTSYLLSYNLLIESSGPIKNHPEVLNMVYNETIDDIRKTDPYRIVIITPAHVSKPSYLQYLNVSNDNYTLAEWHIYAGGPRHCSYNISFINLSIQTAQNWSNNTGIPTWVGAWRPFWVSKKDKNVQCPLQKDVEFSKVMVSHLKKAEIPYDINADSWFFNIKNLTWYANRTEILNIVLNDSKS